MPPAGPLADSAWMIVSHLATGILLYAGVGWAASLWLGNRPLLVAAGALLGLGLSLYLITKRLAAQAPTQQADPGGRRREDVSRVR